MALLSNGSTVKLTSPGSGKQQLNNPNNHNDLFFSNLLNNLPRSRWDGVPSVPVTPSPPRNGGILSDGFLYSRVLGPIGTQSTNHDLGAVGTNPLTPSSSPPSNSSPGSVHGGLLSMVCGRCEMQASNRCLDCNDLLCETCVAKHQNHLPFQEHCVVLLSNLSPIGSIANSIANGSPTQNEPQCDSHSEVLRYVCEQCNKIVCQECTFREHKDHNCIAVALFAEGAQAKIQGVLESGKLGKKYIKASIDRAVAYSQAIERDAVETTQKIRKAMRYFMNAIEERERTLLEKMAGLRSALAGLATTSDSLAKALDTANCLTPLELSTALTLGETQMQQFASMYKSLQPKEEFIAFVAPNFELIQELRLQGDVVITPQRIYNNTVSTQQLASSGNMLIRRPIIRSINQTKMLTPWDHGGSNLGPPLKAITSGKPNIGQSIPGSTLHVTLKSSMILSTSFGFDGQGDGQVSRPWGLCVDKDGNVIVADRRNNRIQVFYPDGSCKLIFGEKGSGNGQFDLPAGISTDPQNRIVVVDKDNHRIQIFTAAGNFVLKFGSYGKDCGQFQYPWDVAINSKGEMLVTDSRNHRIQLFNPDGHFISRFCFDGVNHSRSLKGLTTPRGVCFTPHGDVIVSDFENHRLLLIDNSLSKILALKGHEGTGAQEFSRPSGICCDDDGRVVVADSKNQRVLVFSPALDFLWAVDIRPSNNILIPSNLDEKDRPSDVAILPDGRLVVMVETSPDARDTSNPQKTFIQIY
ncbi:hypothetical protein HA402_002008 [Bradysia odoriphaga]|nr:hypothetical protein HA402_002008 [Bradysia odoriphaga]